MQYSFKSELASAIDASKNNKILEWTIAYLQKEERNNKLVADIQKRKIIKAELIEYPLSFLRRVTGPQNGETNVESLPHWLKQVKAIEEAISKKYMPSPIIVTDFWQELEIADGSHRHEALLKQKFSTYWTIFLFTNLDSVNKMLERVKLDEN